MAILITGGRIVQVIRKCVECGRVFDLRIEADAAEWAYGHDCEC